MKISWGTRIAALYIAFVLMIATLVAATFRSKPVLVTQDYYFQETKFQERLDAERALAGLGTPPAISRSADSVWVIFPAAFRGVAIEGTIACYFPANAAADRIIPFRTDAAVWSFKAPAGGDAYQVRIDWTGKGVHYYYQQP